MLELRPSQTRFSLGGTGEVFAKRHGKGRCPLQSVDVCLSLVQVLEGFSWLREIRQLTSLDRFAMWTVPSTGIGRLAG